MNINDNFCNYRGGVTRYSERVFIRYSEGVFIRYSESASIRYRALRIFRKRGGYNL